MQGSQLKHPSFRGEIQSQFVPGTVRGEKFSVPFKSEKFQGSIAVANHGSFTPIKV